MDERAKALEEQIKTKRRKAQERGVVQPSLMGEVQAADSAQRVREAEAHPHASLTEIIGVLIEKYEGESEPKAGRAPHVARFFIRYIRYAEGNPLPLTALS